MMKQEKPPDEIEIKKEIFVNHELTVMLKISYSATLVTVKQPHRIDVYDMKKHQDSIRGNKFRFHGMTPYNGCFLGYINLQNGEVEIFLSGVQRIRARA